jgi:polysaccharide biosynthesis protein PslH
MRILQICNKVPFPPKDGGCIAMNNLTMGLLEEGHQVKVLAINTPKHFVDIETLPKDYRSNTNIEAVFIDTGIKVIPAFLNLFSSESYNVSRFYSPEFDDKLKALLSSETFDIILLESLFVSMYIPAIRKISKAKIVLRAHNIEHRIWERNAASSGNPLKKIYFDLLARRLKQYEISTLRSYDAVAAITEEDARWFREQNIKVPVKVVPFGIDLNKLPLTKNASDSLSVFHIGAMDWQPNVEGVKWFLNNVWNKVHNVYPSLKLHLAGRKMPDEFKNMNRADVIVEGEVEDAYSFMQSQGLMIVPLLAGGGMRVKIIEGMALGKVIVTTKIGAEGINHVNGKDIMIANTSDEFVTAISRYIDSPDHLSDIGKNAKLVAEQQYNNRHICRQLIVLFDSIRTKL